jgi:hypothetical protein
VFRNVGRALDAAGALPEDVAVIEEGRVALFGDHRPADTIVGVEALSRPEYLIEVEATAVTETGARGGP